MAMFIILLTPVVHLVLAFIFDARLGGILRVGGVDPARIGAVGVLAIYIVVSNIGTVIESVRAGGRNDPVDQSKDP